MQDGWKIEVRKRLTGKLKGQQYKVFIGPDGAKFYSLAKAISHGFNGGSGLDGRKKKTKKAKSKANLGGA